MYNVHCTYTICKDKGDLLLQNNVIFNNKWLNKIVKLTFEMFGQSK